MTAQPTLRQLRFVVALSEQLHFGKAADSCFVTQSTLSSGIKELEELLGVQVVERTKRSVMMTPLGEEIVTRAREILQLTDDLVAFVDESAAPFSGKITFGVIPTIGPYVMPDILRAVRSAHPAFKLYLREQQTADLLARLRDGTVDVALLAFPYEIDDALHTEILGEDAFCFLCAKDHPLAGKGPIDNKRLQGEDLLLLEEGHCLRDHALGACQLRTAQKARSNVFQATSLTTLVQMVEAGLGTTLVPRMAVQSGAIDKRRLCVREISGTAKSRTPGRSLGLVWRKTSHRADEFRALADLIHEVLKD